MSHDPDLYGPPEYEPEDPQQDDDWEALLEGPPPGWRMECPRCQEIDGLHAVGCLGIAIPRRVL